MTDTEFITLVSRMREAQRIYELVKNDKARETKLKLEKEVDEEIKRIMAFTNPPAFQPSLFQNEVIMK